MDLRYELCVDMAETWHGLIYRKENLPTQRKNDIFDNEDDDDHMNLVYLANIQKILGYKMVLRVSIGIICIVRYFCTSSPATISWIGQNKSNTLKKEIYKWQASSHPLFMASKRRGAGKVTRLCPITCVCSSTYVYVGETHTYATHYNFYIVSRCEK